ncbi:MAG TPA: HAMP domain-containing sensor histidine kinase [Opitutus sp.]|nr:HAMP domain-containing sensor histidine kinase [Opitutus sp.]
MAVVAVAVAALLREALTPVWGEFDRPFILFFPAVVFAAWYGRLGAAVVAIILGTLVANYLFLEPGLSFQRESLKQWTLLIAFVAVSFAIALLIERMHRATTQAVREASERRRSEIALRDSERELRAARDEALAANAAKDRFLAVLSHELRTPLNPILLLASEHAQDESLRKDIRSTFQTIADNAAMEARLIDDLLDLSRIIHGKLVLEHAPAEIHAIIIQSLAVVSDEIAAKRLQVRQQFHAESSTVLADGLRLKQVFANLLRNAVKFTPGDGSIEVRTQLTEDRTSIDVSITDTGIGMTGGEIARTFHPFAQGDHATAGAPGSSGGLGLGLAISKQIIEGHGGKIWAESGGRGKGTRLRVRLSLVPSEIQNVRLGDAKTSAGSSTTM